MSTLNKWVNAHRGTDVISDQDRELAGYAEEQRRRLDPGTVATAMVRADSRRDVGFACRRALALLDEQDLHRVWTGRKLTAEQLYVDHCLP